MATFSPLQHDPNHSRYSRRIPDTQWLLRVPTIVSLHEARVPRKEILAKLASEHSFRPSMGQLVTKSLQWNLQVYRKFSDVQRRPESSDSHIPEDDMDADSKDPIGSGLEFDTVNRSALCGLPEITSAGIQTLAGADLHVGNEEIVNNLATMFNGASTEQQQSGYNETDSYTGFRGVLAESESIESDDEPQFFETATVSTDTRTFQEYALMIQYPSLGTNNCDEYHRSCNQKGGPALYDERIYELYSSGKYPYSSDEHEQGRLDLIHYLLGKLLDGQLFSAPITKNPERVLDLGCGTGAWVIDVAIKFDDTCVVGLDLSMIQPKSNPPNAKFHKFDIDNDCWPDCWPYQNFDLIHGRSLAGSITDWPRLYGEIYESLKPGVGVEMEDMDLKIRSIRSSIGGPQGPKLMRWEKLMEEAAHIFGKELNVATSHGVWMMRAGFINVNTIYYQVPLGRWPKDKRLKEIGIFQQEVLCYGIAGLSFALLTKALGWTVESVRAFLLEILTEIKTERRDRHDFYDYTIVYGQRPTEE